METRSTLLLGSPRENPLFVVLVVSNKTLQMTHMETRSKVLLVYAFEAQRSFNSTGARRSLPNLCGTLRIVLILQTVSGHDRARVLWSENAMLVMLVRYKPHKFRQHVNKVLNHMQTRACG